MKIAFFSNYLNHHQLPLSEALLRLTQGQFYFVACSPIGESRLALGYRDMNAMPFVVREYEGGAQAEMAARLCEECDVVIFGDADNKYAKRRIVCGKLLLRYSERWLKNGIWHAYSPRAIYFTRKEHADCGAPVYLLCASAYAAADAERFGVYRGKTYKWGYFPEARRYGDIDALIEKKERGSILWVSRFIDWKHPEIPVRIAKKLMRAGCDFQLNMIGIGPQEEKIRRLAKKEGVEERVHFLGSMEPARVREYMERSEIFLFTSDFNEGWGAVLNEAMNSGCAVAASHASGAAPYLVKNGVNGLLYKNKDIGALYEKTLCLLKDDAYRKKLGQEAYRTILREWNADTAAERLLLLAEELLCKGKCERFDEGPCSPAEILKNGWFTEDE